MTRRTQMIGDLLAGMEKGIQKQINYDKLRILPKEKVKTLQHSVTG